MAVNELSIVHYLMGGQLPVQKWGAAVSPITDRLPVVPLLGALCSFQLFQSRSLHQLAAGAEAQVWAAAMLPVTDRLPVVPLLGAHSQVLYCMSFGAVGAEMDSGGFANHRPATSGAAAGCITSAHLYGSQSASWQVLMRLGLQPHVHAHFAK